jgi:hypothetical protein
MTVARFGRGLTAVNPLIDKHIRANEIAKLD